MSRVNISAGQGTVSRWQFPADSVLPWQSGVAEDVRFKRFLFHGVGILFVVAILMPFFPVPETLTAPVAKEREQYTRLIIEEKILPPPVEIKPQPLPAPIVKPVPKVEVVKPKPIDKPKPVEKPKTKPIDLMKQARDKAATTGVLAFADDLSALRESVDVSNIKRSNLTRGAAQAERTERKMLTAKASSKVGGISTAALSTDTGGVALSSRETTLIDAPSGAAMANATQAAASDAVDYSGRSAESVRRIMDANKGAIFAIYNRALRKDPSLSGKVLFQLLVEPSGAVAEIKLLSSELADQALVSKILSRIKMINFGSEPVEQTEVNYSFDFLPY